MTQTGDTRDRVRSALASAFTADGAALHADISLRDDLGADSLAIVEVLAGLERDLAVELPDSDEFLANLRTVGDMVRAFEDARAEAGG